VTAWQLLRKVMSRGNRVLLLVVLGLSTVAGVLQVVLPLGYRPLVVVPSIVVIAALLRRSSQR